MSKYIKPIKTGIAGLDEFLLGGLTPGVYILMGPLESGKEVFAQQIVYTRARQNKITYFTVSRTPESIKDDMTTYGWDVSQYEKEDRLRLTNLTQSESLIDTVKKEIEQQRGIIIDSLSELLITEKTEEAIHLLNTISKYNKEQQELHLVLLTTEMQDQKTETIIQHFADGVIEFATRWDTEILARTMVIKKMKGTIIPTRRLPYSLGRNGFTIETATRIT
jgi:KaiC/GvpD/RAD55 family RecA-like ATPase